jgi:hypothetical protein
VLIYADALDMLQILSRGRPVVKGYVVLKKLLFGVAHFSNLPTFFICDISYGVRIIDFYAFECIISRMCQMNDTGRNQIVLQWTNALETLSTLQRAD